MRGHPSGRSFLAAVTLCAIGTFVLCYLFLRPDIGSENLSQEGVAEQTHSAKTGIERSIASKSLVASKHGEQSNLPYTPVVESSAVPLNRSDATVLDSATPPSSITFRAPQSPQKQATSQSSVQTDDAERSDAQSKEIVRSIEVHADSGGCKVCSNSKSWGINIPKECTYASHTLTQLRREPYVPIEQTHDRFTSYTDFLDPDAKGQIEGVRISVEANQTGTSTLNPSITMRLTVVTLCPSDAIVGGVFR